MKFVNNHDYRFFNFKIAYLACFMQITMVVTAEIVNFIAVLSSKTTLGIIMIFVALKIIADFDDFFYAILGKDPGKEVINDTAYDELWMIKRTTSKSYEDSQVVFSDCTF
jgi:hypothetical protein